MRRICFHIWCIENMSPSWNTHIVHQVKETNDIHKKNKIKNVTYFNANCSQTCANRSTETKQMFSFCCFVDDEFIYRKKVWKCYYFSLFLQKLPNSFLVFFFFTWCSITHVYIIVIMRWNFQVIIRSIGIRQFLFCIVIVLLLVNNYAHKRFTYAQ